MVYMRIKELRESKGFSQASLALYMGTAQNVVSNWETGVALPKARDLPLLANVLEVSINDLYTDEAKASLARGAEQIPACPAEGRTVPDLGTGGSCIWGNRETVPGRGTVWPAGGAVGALMCC